jgi:archaemetzincin
MIQLIPIGQTERSVLERLVQPLREIYLKLVRIDEAWDLPEDTFDTVRRQYSARHILERMPLPDGGDDKLLGIVEVDLFAPQLNYVFGQAEMSGKRSVISLVRLRPEFHGKTPDDELFIHRALKEAVHELGHTFGLEHCPEVTCVMHFSNGLSDTDKKDHGFCKTCRTILFSEIKVV